MNCCLPNIICHGQQITVNRDQLDMLYQNNMLELFFEKVILRIIAVPQSIVRLKFKIVKPHFFIQEFFPFIIV